MLPLHTFIYIVNVVDLGIFDRQIALAATFPQTANSIVFLGYVCAMQFVLIRQNIFSLYAFITVTLAALHGRYPVFSLRRLHNV